MGVAVDTEAINYVILRVRVRHNCEQQHCLLVCERPVLTEAISMAGSGSNIPNPLRSESIPLQLLLDNADVRPRGNPHSSHPYAFISTKHHDDLPLSIHNYEDRAFWNSSPLSSYSLEQLQAILDARFLSDDKEASLALTMASRSLVTHRYTGRVISRSFSKFFNLQEKMSYQPTGREYAHEIQEKVDGSIVSLFWYDEYQTEIGNPARPAGRWLVASRTSFNSPHTDSAWRMLKSRFSDLIDGGKNTLLDKSKTYVFELVDPNLPVKIFYPYGADLVLLAIIGKDGSESKWGSSDFDHLPFRRPRVWKLEDLLGSSNVDSEEGANLRQLSKLDRKNEEGFVVKFWRTKEDVHPQRDKLKLENYLKSHKPGKSGIKVPGALSSISSKQPSNSKIFKTQVAISGPPTPASLLKMYTSHRLSLPSFVGVDGYMSSLKQPLLDAVQNLNVMDDYGGEAWLTRIARTWDRIDALFSLHEGEWRKIIGKLEKEGFRSKSPRKSSANYSLQFEKRIGRTDVDQTLIPLLRAWFERRKVEVLVKLLVECMDFPSDLKSEDVVLMD